MKTRLIIASTALSLAAFTGSALADLPQDLTTMSAGQALSRAMQSGNQSIETVIAEASAELQDNPEQLAALVVAAVADFPEQIEQIVYFPVCQVFEQNKASVTSALLAASEGNEDLQSIIEQTSVSCQQTLEAEQAEIEAEQSEVGPPPIPLPPTFRPDPDKPPAISPN